MAPRTSETSSRDFECWLRLKQVIPGRAHRAQTAMKLATGTDGVMRWPQFSFIPERSGFYKLFHVIMNLSEATAKGCRSHVELVIQSFWFCATTELGSMGSPFSASFPPPCLRPRCGTFAGGIEFYLSMTFVRKWRTPPKEGTPSPLLSTTGTAICIPMRCQSCGSIRFPRQL